MAVWIEDTDGRYLSTGLRYPQILHAVVGRVGRQPAQGESAALVSCAGRALCRRTVLPTKRDPLADGISGATPRESYELKVTPQGGLRRFIVKFEVNHSTDFNEFYSESAREGDPGWSGGKEGSGQPALVYAADVDLDSGDGVFAAAPVGHGSPDGSDGSLSPDLSTLTSALHILERITVTAARCDERF